MATGIEGFPPLQNTSLALTQMLFSSLFYFFLAEAFGDTHENGHDLEFSWAYQGCLALVMEFHHSKASKNIGNQSETASPCVAQSSKLGAGWICLGFP